MLGRVSGTVIVFACEKKNIYSFHFFMYRSPHQLTILEMWVFLRIILLSCHHVESVLCCGHMCWVPIGPCVDMCFVVLGILAEYNIGYGWRSSEAAAKRSTDRRDGHESFERKAERDKEPSAVSRLMHRVDYQIDYWLLVFLMNHLVLFVFMIQSNTVILLELTKIGSKTVCMVV